MSTVIRESTAVQSTNPRAHHWTRVCRVDKVRGDRGIAVLVQDHPVALFGLEPSVEGGEKQWFAVDHVDPATAAPVIARGLVGSNGDTPTVSSPLHKHKYCLRTGVGIDSPDLNIGAHSVRVVGDWVEIQHVQRVETP